MLLCFILLFYHSQNHLKNALPLITHELSPHFKKTKPIFLYRRKLSFHFCARPTTLILTLLLQTHARQLYSLALTLALNRVLLHWGGLPLRMYGIQRTQCYHGHAYICHWVVSCSLFMSCLKLESCSVDYFWKLVHFKGFHTYYFVVSS